MKFTAWTTVAVLGSILSMSASAQLIVAHRGASYDAPENTLAAFKLAWEEGADGIEGDFYLSVEGQVACIHATDTKRVAGKELVVSETSWKELSKLDVVSWKSSAYAGERMPLLTEVFYI